LGSITRSIGLTEGPNPRIRQKRTNGGTDFLGSVPAKIENPAVTPSGSSDTFQVTKTGFLRMSFFLNASESVTIKRIVASTTQKNRIGNRWNQINIFGKGQFSYTISFTLGFKCTG
jgi:hypothetical protein